MSTQMRESTKADLQFPKFEDEDDKTISMRIAGQYDQFRGQRREVEEPRRYD